jgi:hypothetical protein
MTIQVLAQSSSEIPAGGNVTVSSGIETPIYGARARCGSQTAPTFEEVIERGLEVEPEHGKLSDGGTGTRYSQKCNSDVLIRIISYTSNEDYIGEDQVVIYGDETNITVEDAQ